MDAGAGEDSMSKTNAEGERIVLEAVPEGYRLDEYGCILQVWDGPPVVYGDDPPLYEGRLEPHIHAAPGCPIHGEHRAIAAEATVTRLTEGGHRWALSA